MNFIKIRVTALNFETKIQMSVFLIWYVEICGVAFLTSA